MDGQMDATYCFIFPANAVGWDVQSSMHHTYQTTHEASVYRSSLLSSLDVAPSTLLPVTLKFDQ